MRDSFIFYRSFFESIVELPKKDKCSFFEALCDYALNDVEPELSGGALALFKALKPQVDANTRKYLNGCKGGRPKSNQTETKPKPNDNENDNDNENENGNVSGSVPNTDAASLAPLLLDRLNEKAGTSYAANPTTVSMVKNLLDSGYSQNQIRTVIDKKCSEWVDDPKMRQYLRPSTLFGKKFEEYLNAPISFKAETKQKKDKAVKDLRKQLEEKQKALSDIEVTLSAGGITTNERRALRDQQAVLEDSIEIIQGRLRA